MLRAGAGSPRASPREPRHAGAGHRSPVRPAQCALVPLGEVGADPRLTCARPRPSPRPSAIQPRLGRVSAYLCIHSREMGDHDRAIAAGQRALALASTLGDVRPAGRGPALPWGRPTMPWATIVGRWMLRGGAMTCSLASDRSVSASARSACPPCSPVPGLAGALPSWERSPRGGAMAEEAVRIAEAVDHPNSHCRCVSRCRSALPPPGGPHQAIPVLERGLDLCRVATSRSVPRDRLRPWAVRMPWPGVSPRPCRCWSRRCSAVAHGNRERPCARGR